MIAKDKQLHLLAGFAAGTLPALALPGAGTVIATIAGVAKEHDDGHGNTRGDVDPADLAFTVLGGLIADLWILAAAALVAASF